MNNPHNNLKDDNLSKIFKDSESKHEPYHLDFIFKNKHMNKRRIELQKELNA